MNINPKSKIKIVHLGGLGEIGRNMMLVGYEEDYLIIDCGISFPPADLLGVDLGIPDMSFIKKISHQIKGILITHGHEDHIGGLPFLLEHTNAPIYSSKFTHGLISVKLKEFGSIAKTTLKIIEPFEKISISKFSIQFFNVCHSIPDAMGITIDTPLGMIVHTGDFKIDHTPTDGKLIDFQSLSSLFSKGVLALCSDSTYAELKGFTPSESQVTNTLYEEISSAKGRVIISTFASQIYRIQQIIDACKRTDKKVAVVGRKMSTNIKMALKLGYLNDSKNCITDINSLLKLPDQKCVMITTGSQGEPTSVMTQIANEIHPRIIVKNGDKFIFSSSPIPGNEPQVVKNIDKLFKQGADVIYNKISKVHVRGHASQEELKLMISLAKPQYFIPVHGEHRHLVAHSKIAQEMGIPNQNTFVIKNGDVLEITPHSAEVTDEVPAENLYFDGKAIRNVKSHLISDRKELSRHGIIYISINSLNINSSNPSVTLSSYGLFDEFTDYEISENTGNFVQTLLANSSSKDIDLDTIKRKLVTEVKSFVSKVTGKKPVVIVEIHH